MKIARIISYLFIPPVLTLYSFIHFAIIFENSFPEKLIVIITAFLFGLIFPIVFFETMRRRGKILDVDATAKKERTLPYAVGILFSLAALLILYMTDAHPMILGLWAAYILNSAVLMLINKSWKMSAHAMGVAIPFAAILFAGNLAAIILFLILILVCWARVKLGVHTLSQVFLGSVSGTLVTLLVFYLI